MRPLRLTAESLKVAAEWSSAATPKGRALLADMLRTIESGAWKARWWHEPYSSDPEVIELRLGIEAHVFIRIFADEDEPEGTDEFAEIMSIVTSERD